MPYKARWAFQSIQNMEIKVAMSGHALMCVDGDAGMFQSVYVNENSSNWLCLDG